MPFCQTCGEPCFKPPCPCGSGEKPKLNNNFADEEQDNHGNAYLSSGITSNNNAVEGLKNAAGFSDEDHRKMANMAHTSQVAKPVQTKRMVTTHDHGVSPTCDKCHQSIGGEGIHALGGTYHHACLRCDTCNSAIEGAFNQRDGKLWCKPCYDRVRAQKQAEYDRLTREKQERDAFVARQRAMSGGVGPGAAVTEPCAHCGQALGSAQAVRSQDALFHLHCFEARTGGTVGTGGSWCEKCRQPFNGGTFVKAGGHKFHKECFICASCHQQLSGQFAQVDGQFKCAACATTHRVIPTGQPGGIGPQRRGFVVDPVTGQKRYM